MNVYIRNGHEIGLDWNYVLVQDVTFNFGKQSIPCEVRNEWFWMRMSGDDLLLTVFKDYAWDGCSVVPDFKGTIIASIPHDIIYQFETLFRETWGWSSAGVLMFANKIFKIAMEQTGTWKVVKWTYFIGVVMFGYPFHWLKFLVFGTK